MPIDPNDPGSRGGPRDPDIESGGSSQLERGSDMISGGSSQLSSEAGEQVYTVVKGDTLSAIAQRFYGKASLWKRIHQANTDQISNPDLIRPGQVLKIPKA
jgi:nucleoid-associated protein YgaU